MKSLNPQREASVSPFIRLCRPKQWLKNLLVAAAPFAAGVMNDLGTVVTVFVGIVAFSAVSSGMYVLNDVRDAEADARHPRKSSRPVAAGVIATRTALVFGLVLTVVGIIAGAAAGSAEFLAFLALYVASSVAYSMWLKQYALVDIAVVAFGFLVRALAGAALVEVPVSPWFLIVTMFGALLVAAGRRYSERVELREEAFGHRPALDDYAPGFLEFLLGVSAGVVLLAYSFWALEVQAGTDGEMWAAISLGPFTLGVLRYAQLIYLGRGGEPETLVFGDRGLQVAGAVWLVTVTAAVYVGAG